MILTRLEEVVLIAIWRLQVNAYGMRIRREVMRVLDEDIAYGTLYSALDQLVRKSLVAKSVGDTVQIRGGRRRMYYALAPEGAQALESARQQSRTLWNEIPEMAFIK